MDAFKIAGLPVKSLAMGKSELVPLKLITARNRNFVIAAMVIIAEADEMIWDENFRDTPDGHVAVGMKKGTEVIAFEVFARDVAPVEYFLVPMDRRDWTGTGVNTAGKISAMKYGVRGKAVCRVEVAKK
jgi:hypothetical protein